MTNAIQWSDKIGDAILVVGGDNPEEFQTNMATVLGLGPYNTIMDAFTRKYGGVTEAVAVNHLVEGGLVHPQEAARAQAPQSQPAAYQGPQPQAQGPQAPYQPPQAAPQAAPPNGAPNCQHGVKQWRQDKHHNPPEWRAWGCPADRNDPTKCGLEYV